MVSTDYDYYYMTMIIISRPYDHIWPARFTWYVNFLAAYLQIDFRYKLWDILFLWLILIVLLQTILVSNNRDKAFSSDDLVKVYSTEQIRLLTFVQLMALTISVGKRQCIGLRYFTAEDFRCQLCRWWSKGDPLIQPDEKQSSLLTQSTGHATIISLTG